MAYINSENIKVFPSTRRVATQVDARLMTEASMVGIINQLIGKNGFVITQSFNANNPFEFNIFGYYFRVGQGSYVTSSFGSATEIWGKITLDTTTYTELSGQDEDQVYKGLELVSSEPTASSTVKYLKLLEKVGNTWRIPESSKLLFNDNQLDIDIDGGVISD